MRQDPYRITKSQIKKRQQTVRKINEAELRAAGFVRCCGILQEPGKNCRICAEEVNGSN
jgi:hypothetical protein